MNPYEKPLTPHEQTLRNEVIYLHSLWHQGPPTLNPNPNFYPPNHVNYSSRNLHASNPTSFKKTYRHQTIYRKAKDSNVAPSGPVFDPQPDPGPEWPVNPPQPSPPQSGSGWPEIKPNLSSSARPVSEADLGKVAAMHMQQKVVECCHQFFVKRVDLDGNEDNKLDEIDEDEDSYCNDNDVEESEELKFLLSLFVENQELRDFYEKNTESGDFYCLVCGGIGEKVGKVYRGCTGLVQHARSISKTKRKRAHRAFCHLICKVLGWDISRLPMIVLKGEPLSRSLANSGQTENFSDYGDGKKVHENLSIDVPNMEAYKEGATECAVEPEINVDCRDEDSSFLEPETVHGNVSVSASREYSGIHQQNSVQNTSNGGVVNVNDLEKECIKADKLSLVDSKANLKESGGNYKKQNIAFWVNNCCWPETKESKSTRKANSLEEGRESKDC